MWNLGACGKDQLCADAVPPSTGTTMIALALVTQPRGGVGDWSHHEMGLCVPRILPEGQSAKAQSSVTELFGAVRFYME